MATVFDDIRALRNTGVVHCGTSPATELAAAAADFQLATDPAGYQPIDASFAREILVLIFSRDLAYEAGIMPVERAEELAACFLAAVAPASHLYSNVTAPLAGPRRGRVRIGLSWIPATDATFDVGVLAVSPSGSACVWVEDED